MNGTYLNLETHLYFNQFDKMIKLVKAKLRVSIFYYYVILLDPHFIFDRIYNNFF